MKRRLTLIMAATLAVVLLAGCELLTPAPAPTQPVEGIPAGVGQVFSIALSSNPSTGYDWEATYDKTMIALVGKTFQPAAAQPDTVGAGGTDLFQFKALKAGKTNITMKYQRAGDTEPMFEQTLPVVIQ
ncbi:MAG: protease inhibitor I42 family protein [Chloroflexota bacterium]